MLDYSQVKPGKIIVFEGEPYTVLSSHVFRKQQRKPVNQTKLKNLITGKVLEHSFQSSDKVEEADIEKMSAKFLYNKYNRQLDIEEYWFSGINDPSNRFPISSEIIGGQISFLKENAEIDIVMYDEKPVGIELPIKMSFKVTEAPPNVKGGTASGGNKQAIIETGATLNVPMFVETGDEIVVNTTTGEYVERAKN